MSRPYLIGITGGSGSGKTTFIHQIRNAFSDNELCIVSQDDYYQPREMQMEDPNGIPNFDLPASINREEFHRDVLLLLAGKVVKRTEYTFNNPQAKPRELIFRPAPVVILEGIFVFHFEEIRRLLDLRVFLHAKENLKVIRRIRRDRVERNYPLDDVLYRYQHHVSPAFERYIRPYQDEADIVINNNSHFEAALEVIKGFLQVRIASHGTNFSSSD
jgi:uridine kinase